MQENQAKGQMQYMAMTLILMRLNLLEGNITAMKCHKHA